VLRRQRRLVNGVERHPSPASLRSLLIRPQRSLEHELFFIIHLRITFAPEYNTAINFAENTRFYDPVELVSISCA
jgi:hypothetical protein